MIPIKIILKNFNLFLESHRSSTIQNNSEIQSTASGQTLVNSEPEPAMQKSSLYDRVFGSRPSLLMTKEKSNLSGSILNQAQTPTQSQSAVNFTDQSSLHSVRSRSATPTPKTLERNLQPANMQVFSTADSMSHPNISVEKSLSPVQHDSQQARVHNNKKSDILKNLNSSDLVQNETKNLSQNNNNINSQTSSCVDESSSSRVQRENRNSISRAETVSNTLPNIHNKKVITTPSSTARDRSSSNPVVEKQANLKQISTSSRYSDQRKPVSLKKANSMQSLSSIKTEQLANRFNDLLGQYDLTNRSERTQTPISQIGLHGQGVLVHPNTRDQISLQEYRASTTISTELPIRNTVHNVISAREEATSNKLKTRDEEIRKSHLQNLTKSNSNMKLAGMNLNAFDTVTLASDVDSVRTDFISKNFSNVIDQTVYNQMHEPSQVLSTASSATVVDPLHNANLAATTSTSGNLGHGHHPTQPYQTTFDARLNAPIVQLVQNPQNHGQVTKYIAETEVRLQSQQLALQSLENKLKQSQDLLMEKRATLKDLTFKCHDTQRSLNNAEDELGHLIVKIEQKRTENEKLAIENEKMKNINHERKQNKENNSGKTVTIQSPTSTSPANSESLKNLEDTNIKLQQQLLEERKKNRISQNNLEEKNEELNQKIDELKEEKFKLEEELNHVNKHKNEDQQKLKEEVNLKLIEKENAMEEIFKNHIQEKLEIKAKLELDYEERLKFELSKQRDNLDGVVDANSKRIKNLEEDKSSLENKLEIIRTELKMARDEKIDLKI